MAKKGEYEWWQLSQWDFAPEKSVVKYRTIKNHLTGAPVQLTFYLKQCTETDGNRSKWRTVQNDEKLPPELPEP